MSSRPFSFKQFTVQQTRSALKVTTDSCLLGAWVSSQEPELPCLEIGAGTGVVSLMLAQRQALTIVAVEIDAASCLDCQENFEQSPWQERLRLQHCDIKDFQHTQDQAFGLIFSNPPYFQQDLRSPSREKSLSKHASTLDFSELLASVHKNLHPKGQLALILPSREADIFCEMAEKQQLFLQKCLKVSNYEGQEAHRSLLLFGREKTACHLEQLVLREKNQDLHPQFKQMMQPYYLLL